jgi:hypothetical protein
LTAESFARYSKLEDLPALIQADPLLCALWYAQKNNWTKAHDIVQELHSKPAARIHAYLHRQEGDLGNAAYWYRQANEDLVTADFATEWQELVTKQLASLGYSGSERLK